MARLVWDLTHDNDDNPVFVATGCQHTDGSPFEYRVVMDQAIGAFVLRSDAELMLEGDAGLRFTTLDDATSFCQLREYEALQAAKTAG
jgi:hypothetical protein